MPGAMRSSTAAGSSRLAGASSSPSRASPSSPATRSSTGCAIRIRRPFDARRDRRPPLEGVSQVGTHARVRHAEVGAPRALARGGARSEVVVALSDVSFTVARGETFGVVGPNGSGKSTLLKLVAGLFKPTSGQLTVDGKVSALIELGAGFHPEISGRENVVINGVMLGLTRKEIERKLPEIVGFSGLEDFIDEPVKTYSSGMYVRLGFAVAVHVDPDILVVDEVLAVGDEAFAHRCLDTIAEFSRRGKTIFF